ncbi:MAG TPA: T9SS type A sorting domain-containing protein, partial [Balneolaceae bacterium]|nr:T9SS type A sorting domain-containing protein [Balneolaceae bacterium]
GLPESFEIKPAYPNPFNPSTQLVFALPERGEVRIRVYDITGRLVSVLANQTFDAGRHQLTFDAGRLASGVYLIRGNAAGEVFTQRVTLIK